MRTHRHADQQGGHLSDHVRKVLDLAEQMNWQELGLESTTGYVCRLTPQQMCVWEDALALLEEDVWPRTL